MKYGSYYSFSQLAYYGIFIERGMLCKSLYGCWQNDFFVISRLGGKKPIGRDVFCYRVKMTTLFDEPEVKFDHTSLLYYRDSVKLWEERLDIHLGNVIYNRFEILDL